MGNRQKELDDMKLEIESKFSDKITYHYFVHQNNHSEAKDLKRLCVNLEKKETLVHLNGDELWNSLDCTDITIIKLDKICVAITSGITH